MSYLKMKRQFQVYVLKTWSRAGGPRPGEEVTEGTFFFGCLGRGPLPVSHAFYFLETMR